MTHINIHFWLKLIRVILIISVMLANTNGLPTRKTPAEIPGAPYSDGCRILINEFRLDPVTPFFEFARYCIEPVVSLTNKIDVGKYALLVVDHREYIIGVCYLSHKHNTNGVWFYVIGDGENANQDISDCQWEHRMRQGNKLYFPWRRSALGIYLIKNDRLSVLQNFELPKTGDKYVSKKITPQLAKLLIGNLQDFYILANHDLNVPDVLTNFEKYYSSYSDSDSHVLYSDLTQDHSKSISRCGSQSDLTTYSLPFQYKLMQLTTKSPGYINVCTQSEPTRKKLRTESSVVVECETTIEDNEPLNIVPNEQEIESLLEHMPTYFWKGCENFPNNKIMAIQELPFTPVNIEDVIKIPVCTWIDFIMPINRFICKKCNILLRHNIISDRKESTLVSAIMKQGDIKIAKDAKTSARARRDNAKMFADHTASTIHQISEQYFELFASGLRTKDLQEALEKEGGPYRNYFQATENVILATIQSVRMNIPFRSFNILAETLDHFGANIGHLYRTPSGTRMISDVVGNKLHKDLIAQLLKLDKEISITLDSTTDIAGYGLLGVVFQTFNETGHVNSYLYRIMPLPQGEKGVELFDQFMKSIRDDGLENYIKKRTVGLTTDGHPAVRRVFRRLLNEEIDNELIGVWCNAHVLELVASKAFELFPYLVEIDTFVNRIFKLLTAKSPLRRDEFRKQIPLFGFRLFEFKRVRKLRWLAHHVRALSPFIFRFPVLLATLKAIGTERKHNLKTRKEAKELLQVMKDSTFLLTIAFTADVLQILAELSLEYQRINNTPIGKKFLRSQLYEKLSALENTYGPHVMYVLENSDRIDGVLFNNPVLTIESGHIRFDGVEMNQPDPIYEDYRLSSKMEAYVDAILAQIEEYYPADVLDHFDVLYAKRFPAVLNTEVGEIYGRSDILELNRRLKWGYDEQVLIQDWRNLLMSLYVHPDFSEAKQLDPETFWTQFLQANYIEWSDITKTIVRKALTIPASSAQPERIFSMYNYVKTYQRYNLLPSTVENIVRIRFNPKNSIKDWNLLGFAKELISENHSRADDTSRRRTWKKAVEELEMEDEELLNELIDELEEDVSEEDDNHFEL